MYITSATLHSMLEDASADDRANQTLVIDKISLNISEELQRVEIHDTEQLAFFLALIFVDSENLSKTEDEASDITPSTFCARGLLKIVGHENYRKFGVLLGVDLETNPHVLADPPLALRVAAEIWQTNYRDHIAVGDLEGITQEFALRGRPFSHEEFDRCLVRIVRVLAPTSTLVGGSRGSPLRTHGSAGANFPVWYGTNRRPVGAGLGVSYSSERDDMTHLGRCSVFIPTSHKIGSIGSSLVKRILSGSNDLLQIKSVEQLDANAYWEGMRGAFNTSNDPKIALVFVHGYNVSFESAAIRAAQIGYDLGAQRAMAFFSWPSQGRLSGYLADAAAVEASEEPIARFLVDFAERSGAERVHLIAHSMGNRGVLRAITRIAARAVTQSNKLFGQIILAAADVDADLFRQNAACYLALSERTSVYVSSRDKAVEASRWLHEFARVGLTPPTVIVDGIDTISVANVDMSILGHGYFSEARNVLADLYDLVVHGSAPDTRFGLREQRAEDGKRFWQIKA